MPKKPDRRCQSHTARHKAVKLAALGFKSAKSLVQKSKRRAKLVLAIKSDKRKSEATVKSRAVKLKDALKKFALGDLISARHVKLNGKSIGL